MSSSRIRSRPRIVSTPFVMNVPSALRIMHGPLLIIASSSSEGLPPLRV
jgi:hypothetical protein